MALSSRPFLGIVWLGYQTPLCAPKLVQGSNDGLEVHFII
jgi:hypothetical protein